MGYKIHVIKGVSWITLLRFSTRLITFVRLFILGRLLTPTQFGYFGIATLLLAFLEIITETGINIFLVQEKRDIREYINSAWIVSIGRGIILSLLIFLLAPYIALFFKAPNAQDLIALTAIVPLIRGFINPAIITYQKELMFQKEFWLRFILFLVDAVTAIIFAFVTKSAISFVYGLIASAIIEVILSYILIPMWPKLQFEFDKIKHIIRKGWWVTLTGIFSYFAEQGDNIVVGRILNTASLGIYQVAYKLSTLPITEITDVINRVVFPIYVKFSDDRKRLFSAFIKMTSLSSAAAICVGSVLFFFAHPILLLTMGSQWLAAVPVIKVLALYGILRTIFGNFAPVFLSVGRQDYVARMTFARVLGLGVTIIPFVMWYGLIGAGYSALLSIIVEIPLALYYGRKVFLGKDTA